MNTIQKTHQATPTRGVKDLIRLFAELNEIYLEIIGNVHLKVELIKNANLLELQKLNMNNTFIHKKLNERLGFRRQLMDLIAGELNIDPVNARIMTASQLAQWLPEQEGQKLIQAASLLKKTLETVKSESARADRLTKDVLKNLQVVLTSVKQTESEPISYCPQGGTHMKVRESILIDAMG